MFTVIGCALWCSALASLGYSLGSSYTYVLKDFTHAGYFAAALFVVAVILSIGHRLRSVRRENAGHPVAPLSEPRMSTTRTVSEPPVDRLVIDMTEEEIHAWVGATVDKIRRQRRTIEAAGPHLKAVIAAHASEPEPS